MVSVPHPTRALPLTAAPLNLHALTGLGTAAPRSACLSTRGPASGAKVQRGCPEQGRPLQRSRQPFP